MVCTLLVHLCIPNKICFNFHSSSVSMHIVFPSLLIIFLGFYYSSTFALYPRRKRATQCLSSQPTNFTVIREPGRKLFDPKSIRESYKNINFALRGPIHLRSIEIRQELQRGVRKGFQDVIFSNIVDSQGTGQKPNTFLRQVLSLVSVPQLMNSSIFPSDVVQRAKELISQMKGNTIGSMTGENGLEIVRIKVAEFISKRDEIPVSFEDIYLTNGVSGGLELAFKLVQCKDVDVGILTPNPLYPLYSALMTQHGLTKISYNLNPDRAWSLEVRELERAYDNATCSCNCKVRVLVLINPGNPTGKILRRQNLEEIIKFAYSHNLIVFADEIYQHNLLGDVPFLSVHKVAMEMGPPYDKVELVSFHSISKGYTSEGGLRGGYMHLTNIDKGVHDVLHKLLTVQQCPSIVGQVGLYSLVSPPQNGEPSYDSFQREIADISHNYKQVAKILSTELNKVVGFNCSQPEGGPVVFTKFKIPQKAVDEAEVQGTAPDIFYGLELLETMGISVAVGSAFGLSPTQHYMRLSLPAKVEDIDKLVVRLKSFNQQFLEKYS